MRSALALAFLLGACDPTDLPDGGTDAPPATCDARPTLEIGDPVGHPDPLGVGPGEARAGHVDPSALPQPESALLRWGSGEILLANEHVAMAIEEAGPSDLYDPWGGRPTGIARVEGGALVEPGDFGEIFLLVGGHTVMTESVTVMNDGTDGGPAVVRAEGPLRRLPFFQSVVEGLYREDLGDVRAALDYELAPGSRHVDVYVAVASGRGTAFQTGGQLHGFMFTPRMPAFAVGPGFAANDTPGAVDFVAFGDERGTSFTYELLDGGQLAMGVNVSGFVSRISDGRRIPACTTTRYPLARIHLGGPGLDGAIAARAIDREDGQRTVTGVVRNADGSPAEGVIVHALSGATYLTQSIPTGPDGTYVVHVPAGSTVALEPTRPGDARGAPTPLGAGDTLDLTLAEAGLIDVTAVDELGDPLPVRISILPSGTTTLPAPLPASHGGPPSLGGRLHVEYAHTGAATLRAPVGTWEVVVSRGYEYELFRQVVTVRAGETATVAATLARVVDTTNVLCGDFHIHTRRSNDSGDDAVWKVRSAVAEGLEIPVRSDHEYVADFQPILEDLGLTAFAHGIGSIEMTSFQVWGHMGVFPLVPDETAVNAGAPLWQDYPTPASPDVAVRVRSPVEVFDSARARPEAPVVIINHPHGLTNYFGYVGYDPRTGMVDRPDDWDEEFRLVEVFNDDDWRSSRTRTVADWLGFLDHGRRVFAVGSSDTHSLPGSPVGYPRTCIELGTDDPRAITPNMVRDELSAGHATVSGGIYVDATVEGLGPGRDAMGLGTMATVHVRVQAADWIDVDELVLVVDGVDGTPIPILPGDADPTSPVIRWEGDLDVPVDAMGSYVIAVAYGDAPLEPVQPGRIPFGVTNPIFLHP